VVPSARLLGAETAIMATKKKKAKKLGSRTAARKKPTKSKRKAPTKPAKKKMSAPKSKPKRAAKKRAAPKKALPKKAAAPPPKSFAEKLRVANAETDVDGDEMEDEADDAGQPDERDGGDAEEVDADGTGEQE
jgi:hypothetical protein